MTEKKHPALRGYVEMYSHGDWTYFIYELDDDMRGRSHLAVCGDVEIEIDFGKYHDIPPKTFQKMIDLGFPSRATIQFHNRKEPRLIWPPSEADIERAWLAMKLAEAKKVIENYEVAA